jgi:single-stranded DNA-specific DHH superfamily exonuclease
VHKQVLAVTASAREALHQIHAKGGHVPAATLRAYADRLEQAAHRLRRIAAAKEQDPGSGWTLPNFFG